MAGSLPLREPLFLPKGTTLRDALHVRQLGPNANNPQSAAAPREVGR